MIKSATFDPSRRLDLYFRINRDGSKRFTFLDSAGADFDITTTDFELFIKDYAGSRVKVISLTLGDGLSIPAYETNILDADVTDTDTFLNEGEYYWELYLINEKKTWLSGKAFFHNGEFDGVESDTETITITQTGETIAITISDAGASGDVLKWGGLWNFAANAGAFPSTSSDGVLFLAQDDHGNIGDPDFIPEDTWFIAINPAGSSVFADFKFNT